MAINNSSIFIETTKKNGLSEMGFGLAFQKHPHDSEMVLNSDAKRLLRSHRDNCDTVRGNHHDAHSTGLVLETP